MTVCLRCIARLPIGFEGLSADAEADGYRHVRRLAAEFETTPEMFHAVLAGFIDGALAGIGATTDEPQPASEPAWRMRRLYVHRGLRRRGVARAIVAALLEDAANNVRMVTVHAGNDSAARFWQAIGFQQATGKAWTHQTRVCPAMAANASKPPFPATHER
jgi:GNAT superfamily N-acetyltransferase